MPTREQVPSRFVVTDLNTKTTAWLDGLVLDGAVAINLNQPSTIDLSIRPNVREVNGIFPDDMDPRVAQSNRLIYHFMLERKTPVWKVRSAGIIMSPEDQGDSDVPTTHLVAYDPWQYLNGRTAYIDTSGNRPPSADGGELIHGQAGVIAATLLLNAIESDGVGAFIDAGPDYGGTDFWATSGGVIEDTPIIDYRLQQGTTVGDAWTALLSAGQDPDGSPGGLDIVLQPIYDPINRPGFTHNLQIYSLAGVALPGAPMGWGAFNRASTTADRQHDATPSAFINRVAFYAGQGNDVIVNPDVTDEPIVNAPSVAKYGPYDFSQWFPGQPNAVAVAAMAFQALSLQKQGKRTFVLNPDPVRAAPPFQSYNLGDRIPVITDNSLRFASSGFQRIQGIPLAIDTNGFTRVNGLLTTPDWRGDSGT